MSFVASVRLPWRNERHAGKMAQCFSLESPVEFPFQAVYHVTTLNHWKDIAREQLALLFSNRRLKFLTVNIAHAPNADLPYLQSLLLREMERRPELTVLGHFSALTEYEHSAMRLVDQVARQNDMPVLYFHMKGVSLSPPAVLSETWRHHMNTLVGEADRWSEFLAKMPYDACGPLLTTDQKHGFRYFAGNFWMVRAAYVRGLPAYDAFLTHPETATITPGSRHLAELAVNRTNQMRPYATDGTNLTWEGVWPYLEGLCKKDLQSPEGQ